MESMARATINPPMSPLVRTLLRVDAAIALLALGVWGLTRAYDSHRERWASVPGPGTHGPCRKAGALGVAEGRVSWVFAGDSRMRYGLKPAALEKRLEITAANIAEPLNLGGDPWTLLRTLQLLPDSIRSGLSVVFDVSASAVDEPRIASLGMTEFNQWSAAGQTVIFLESPRAFWGYASRTGWPNQMRAWRKRVSGSDHAAACLDYRAFPEGDVRRKGYQPLRKAGPDGDLLPVFTEDGWRAAKLKQAFRELAGLGLRRVVVVAPPFRPKAPGSKAESERERDLRTAEQRFAKWLGASAKETGLDFLDFSSWSGARTRDFVDRYHLNPRGARRWSMSMADSLKGNGWAHTADRVSEADPSDSGEPDGAEGTDG